MPIRVTCGGCAKSFQVKDRFAGLNGICPYCGGSIAVPAKPVAIAVGVAAVGAESVVASAIGDGSGSSSGSGSGSGAPADPSSAVSLAMASEIPRKTCPKCNRQNLAASSACFFCGAQFQDAFDPYHKWLGIPRHEQPPHHYRLLGVALFEVDLDVISEAADQRMAHIRTHQNGPHAPQSQKVLNELSAAKLHLLNRDKKAIYDAQLRQRMGSSAPKSAIPVGTTPLGIAPPAGVGHVPGPVVAAPPMSPGNPMDQMLPPTVWSGAAPGVPYGAPHSGAPLTGVPYGGMPYGGVPGGGMPNSGMQGQPGYYPQAGHPGMGPGMAPGMVGQMGPIPLTSPRANSPVTAAESNVALKARKRASGGGGAGVVQAMIAIGVTIAIMGVVYWMLAGK